MSATQRVSASGQLCPVSVLSRYGVHVLRLDRRIEGGNCRLKRCATASQTTCSRRLGSAPSPSRSASLLAERRPAGSTWAVPELHWFNRMLRSDLGIGTLLFTKMGEAKNA